MAAHQHTPAHARRGHSRTEPASAGAVPWQTGPRSVRSELPPQGQPCDPLPGGKGAAVQSIRGDPLPCARRPPRPLRRAFRRREVHPPPHRSGPPAHGHQPTATSPPPPAHRHQPTATSPPPPAHRHQPTATSPPPPARDHRQHRHPPGTPPRHQHRRTPCRSPPPSPGTEAARVLWVRSASVPRRSYGPCRVGDLGAVLLYGPRARLGSPRWSHAPRTLPLRDSARRAGQLCRACRCYFPHA